MRTVAPRSRRPEVAFACAALTAVLLAALLSLGSTVGQAAPSALLATDVPPFVTGGKAVLIGQHDDGAVLRLNVGLDLRDPAGLDEVTRAITTPGNRAYGTRLTKGQYRERFAPTDASVRAASIWLRRRGLTVTGHTPDNLLIHVRGSTRAVERAFGLAIGDYRLGRRTFYANDRAPTVPSRLGVRWVSGLDNVNVYRLTGRFAPARKAIPTLSVADFRKAYDIKTDGSGLTIGFTLWARALPQSDYDGYAALTGTTKIVIGKSGNNGLDWKPIDGTFGNGSGDAELALDTEIAHAVAPGSHLKVYLGSSSGNATIEDMLNAAANAGLDIVSNSWTCTTVLGCVPDRNMDPILQMGTLQGTNWFFGTGDDGAGGEAHPASNPFVVAVGGTKLFLDGSGNYDSESLFTLAGAGCTNQEPRPSWQDMNEAACLNRRSFPDVVADGGIPTDIYVNGDEQIASGTSLSTPLWAAFATAWNRNNILVARPKVPFLPPLLYELAEGAHAGKDFHDVTTGNNGLSPKAGFDTASGWGSVDLDKLANNPVDLEYTGPLSGNDGETLTLSGELHEHFLPGDNVTVPLAGRQLLLIAATESCQAVTNANGKASCKVTLHANFDPPGHYAGIAAFAGDAAWVGAVAHKDFFVPGIPTKVQLDFPFAGEWSDEAAIHAKLTDDGSSGSHGDPIPGETLHIEIASESCNAVTDSNGVASCPMTFFDPPGVYGVIVLFDGDSPNYLASGDAGHTFTIKKEDDALAYSGPLKGDYHDSFVASASLKDPQGGAPLLDQKVHFQLGATDSCVGTVDENANASCTITPTQAPGVYKLKVIFKGDTFFEPAEDDPSFTILKEEAPAVFSPAPPLKVAVGAGLALSGHLSEDFAPPLAGRTLTFTIGTGPGQQSCTSGLTNAAGNAGCKIVNVQQPEGVQGLLVHFAGDAYYAGSTSGFAIDVYSAKQNTKNVLASVNALIPHANASDRAKLQAAADKLADALVATNWARDGDHLVPKRGDHVFDDEQGAAGKLLELLARSGIPGETLEPLVEKLVEGTKALADVAIDDAVNARGNAGEISQARSERASADASFEARRITEGIGHLKLAWHHAQKAMGRL